MGSSMTSSQIRQQFLDFFASKGHTIVESSPVVPLDDPTLMFTNAGMNQFKDVFLGTGSRSYARAADTQKCIRAGGKHNDLDDVGQDTYHHTFFEMLGNWSFGDYFKKEAIEWAWELFTKVWGIEKQRLYATYFEGDAAEGLEPDTEAEQLWKTVTDIDHTHVHPGGKKDNFWEMGDTGPCGPCSEIHVDLTPDLSGGNLVNAGDPRVIELWNLVFIQFNRAAGGKLSPLPAKHVDTGLGLERLVAVLQGMAAGRIGEFTNYDTDVFTPIFDAIQKRTDAPPYSRTLPTTDPNPSPERKRRVKGEERVTGVVTHEQVMTDVSYRVIADHVRCLTFALTDGAIPSNEGRGYVLRRILRRAVRYGRQYMNMHDPFLCDLVAPLVDHMADAFPELRTAHGGKNVQYVSELIREEETSFLKTLDRGLRVTNAIFAGCRQCKAHHRVPNFNHTYLRAVIKKTFGEASDVRAITSEGRDQLSPPMDVFAETQSMGRLDKLVTVDVLDAILARPGIVPGRVGFLMHDTYGFPIDLTEQMAEEQGLAVDIAEYERLMEQARERSASANVPVFFTLLESVRGQSRFVGYERFQHESAINTLLGLDQNGEMTEVDAVSVGQEAYLILAETPFYPEQGGQIGDRGKVVGVDSDWVFHVHDTQRVHETIAHHGCCVRGQLKIALPSAAKTGGPSLSRARAEVDTSHRYPTTQNHTSTHILNWALREVLEIEGGGIKVEQKGSLVDPEKTRFDFSHNKPLTQEQLERVEVLVNERIEENLQVYTQEVDQEQALEIGTLRAVFGEKYPDRVRVVSAGAPIGQEDVEDPETLLGNPKDPKWMKYPVEFCGGTHLKSTGEAKRFVLTSEEGVAKGIRRVVGISGDKALDAIQRGEALVAEVTALEEVGGAHPTLAALASFQQSVNEATIPLRTAHELRVRIAALQEIAKKQQKQAAGASSQAVMDCVAKLLESAETVAGVNVVVGQVPGAPVDALRSAIDWVRNKTEASAVLLTMVSDNKVTLVAGMSKSVVKKGVKAGDLIREVAPLVSGKGGGRPDMAQGGGSDPSGLPNALDRAKAWICTALK